MIRSARTLTISAVLIVSSISLLAQRGAGGGGGQRGGAQASGGGGTGQGLPQTSATQQLRGTIAGSVVQAGTGIPVKRASVTLRRVNPPTNQSNGNGGDINSPLSLDTIGAQSPSTLGAGGNTRGGGGTRGGATAATGATNGRGGTGGTGGNAATAAAGAAGGNSGAAIDGRGGGGQRGAGGGGQRSTQTDNGGQFTLTNVEPGQYRVSASAEGFLTQEFGQQVFDGPGTLITIGESGSAQVDFQLISGGVVVGTVMDQDGFPLNGVQVQAYTAEFRAGVRTLVPGKTAQTNDIGEYRLPSLTPGEYFVTAKPSATQSAVGPDTAVPVSVGNTRGNNGNRGQPNRGNTGNTRGGNARGGSNTTLNNGQVAELPPPVMVYVPSFYPGSTEASQAVAIQVPGGSDVRGIDIVLRPVSAVTVRGVVIAPSSVVPRQTQNQTQNGAGGNQNNSGRGGGNQTGGRGGAGAGGTGTQTPSTGRVGRGNDFAAPAAQGRGGGAGGRGGGNTGGVGGRGGPGGGQTGGGQPNPAQGNGGGRGGQNGGNAGAANTAVNAQVTLIPIGLNVGGGGGTGGRGGAGGGGAGGRGGGNTGGGGRGGRGNDFAAQGPGGGRGGRGGGNPGAGGAAAGGGRGNPAQGGQATAAPVGGAGQQARATVNRDGTFQINSVIPGSYYLFATGRVSNATVTANMRLDIGAGNIENLALQLRPGSDVPGQIYTETQPPDNFKVQSVRVQLTPADGLPVSSVNATSDEKGAFVLRDVAAAKYRLSINGSQGAYLAQAKYSGFDVLGEPATIDSEVPMNLLIGFSTARIESVVESGGKSYAGATVVLVPADRNRVDLYKTANSGSDGKVSFSNVPPGNYKLYAFESVKQGIWQDSTYMDRFEDRGRVVHTEKSGTVSDLRIPVIRGQ